MPLQHDKSGWRWNLNLIRKKRVKVRVKVQDTLGERCGDRVVEDREFGIGSFEHRRERHRFSGS